jgi:hypothetical protein
MTSTPTGWVVGHQRRRSRACGSGMPSHYPAALRGPRLRRGLAGRRGAPVDLRPVDDAGEAAGHPGLAGWRAGAGRRAGAPGVDGQRCSAGESIGPDGTVVTTPEVCEGFALPQVVGVPLLVVLVAAPVAVVLPLASRAAPGRG